MLRSKYLATLATSSTIGLVALGGVGVAQASIKDVTIIDAGNVISVAMWHGQVSDAIAYANIDLTDKAVVSPGLDDPIVQGTVIVILPRSDQASSPNRPSTGPTGAATAWSTVTPTPTETATAVEPETAAVEQPTVPAAPAPAAKPTKKPTTKPAPPPAQPTMADSPVWQPSGTPAPNPTPSATPTPTPTPTPSPTPTPTPSPSTDPSERPSENPTSGPTGQPSGSTTPSPSPSPGQPTPTKSASPTQPAQPTNPPPSQPATSGPTQPEPPVQPPASPEPPPSQPSTPPTTPPTTTQPTSDPGPPPVPADTCVVNYYNQGIKTDQGQITANGEVFSPHTMTGAHHSLPFGTLVRITNADTGRSAVIRINDRGATSGGRCFSLTVAAYSAITSMTQKSFNATWQIV